ncbi:MAG: RluA family pseudouridine synthase [Armatimonadota bacterium]
MNVRNVVGTTYELIVASDSGERLDVYLARRLDGISRSSIQKLIEKHNILVNGAPVRSSYKVQLGDLIQISLSPPEPTHVVPERIPLDIVYEDESVVVVNKPRGMTTHPAPGSRHGTLVNAILAHCEGLSGIGGEERPGIVHRLDKDTSGLIVVAKTDLAHSNLQRQIQNRTAERRYLALVWGETKFDRAVVDAPIGRHPTDRQKMAVIKDTQRYTARKAITNLMVRQRYRGFTLLEAKLDTGRTHQIRVHCSFIGHPVVGDLTYGSRNRSVPSSYTKQEQSELSALINNLGGQALHAYQLSFDHPVSGERMSFEVPPPREMLALLDWLGRH